MTCVYIVYCISKFKLFPKVWIESIVIRKLSWQWLINFNRTVRREFSIHRYFYDLWWLTRWRVVNEIMIKIHSQREIFVHLNLNTQSNMFGRDTYLWSLSWATPPSVEKWMNFSFNGCKNSNGLTHGYFHLYIISYSDWLWSRVWFPFLIKS